MRLLLDTHLLLWAAVSPKRLSIAVRNLMEDEANTLVFSVVSLWEIAIKRGLKREDFQVDPRLIRRAMLDNQYEELAIASEHVVAVDSLPPIHRDPFDRLLIAQATVEGITLLTSDARLVQYPGPIRLG